MEARTFSVFLDYKCNFSCNHCSVGSSPETVYEMDHDLLDKFFTQLEEVPTVEQLVFTGGEVTLHKETLIKALQRANQEGYLTRIVTNGWWAHNMESAQEMIDELVSAGLDEINTSYDDFHTEYMDIDPIINLTRAAINSDLKNIAIACIIGDQNPNWTAQRIREEINSELEQSLENIQNVTLIEDSAAPLGSGEQLDVSELSSRNKLDVGCPDVATKMSFHPDGSIKACCGHAQFYRPDLTVGNIEEEPLSKIVTRSGQNLIYWLIHEVGPKNLLDMIGVTTEDKYTSICHACGDLLGDHRDEFFEYVQENRTDLIVNEVLLSGRYSEQLDIMIDNREELFRRLDELDENESNKDDLERVIGAIELES